MIFKCKMCGGTLEIKDGQSIATCEYCGTTQTIPQIDDEKIANLYARANGLRRNGEFDRALGIYETILNENPSDSEAYWSIVLCRYGIDYVEDPSSHKRIPTINRLQFTSVFDDEDYKQAISHADASQKTILEKEAEAINQIQKDTLSISSKEKPFDVFICYKETDDKGNRTLDSQNCYDIYEKLTKDGLKVFFARVTLEDKLGTAYEPYIFAALNSAKVMLVFGSKQEYFRATWVKNEWSRYLSLIKKDKTKVLIPIYVNVDPYDLPDEFSHLQAQDYSKIGALQDIVRGVEKIINDSKGTGTEEAVSANLVQPLLKRMNIFLGEGNYSNADAYAEKVLDLDPVNPQAYLGKLLAVNKVGNVNELRSLNQQINETEAYKNVIRYGDENTAVLLEGITKDIADHLEELRKEKIYTEAETALNNKYVSSLSIEGVEKLIEDLTSILPYKEADKHIESLEKKKKDIEIALRNKRAYISGAIGIFCGLLVALVTGNIKSNGYTFLTINTESVSKFAVGAYIGLFAALYVSSTLYLGFKSKLAALFRVLCTLGAATVLFVMPVLPGKLFVIAFVCLLILTVIGNFLNKDKMIISIVLTLVTAGIGAGTASGVYRFNRRSSLNGNGFGVKILNDYINVREQASIYSRQIYTVYKGDTYKIIGLVNSDTRYDYYRIEFKNGCRGYIASAINSPFVETIK